MFPRTRTEWLTCAILITLTWIAFSSVSENDFVNYDDGVYIYSNPKIQNGLTPQSLWWAFTTGDASNWHPLTWIVHITNWEFFGNNPRGHHWVNVGLHSLTCVILFLSLLRMTERDAPPTAAPPKSTSPAKTPARRVGNKSNARPQNFTTLLAAAFVAAAFAIHPQRVESVAWAAELKDVLCALFWWLSIAAYVAYTRQPSTRRYLVVAGCFVLALLSKPMAVTLPLILLLVDYWPLGRFPDRRPSAASWHVQLGRLVVEKLPLFVLTILSCIATYAAQSLGGTTTLLEPVPLSLRLANAAMAAVAYLGQAIWPVNLVCFYPYPQAALRSDGILQIEVIASLLLLIFITGISIWLGRKYRYLFVGWFWYLITLIPVIGIVQVGRQARADRYTYLPMIGVTMALTWSIRELVLRRPRLGPWFATAGVALVAVWMTLTWRQVRFWHDNVTLFRHAAEIIPGNETAEMNLGNTLVQQRDFTEGLVHMKKAIEARPTYAMAWRNMGVALEMSGRPQEAEAYFQQALKLEPNWSLVMCNLAMMYSTSGNPQILKPDEALRLATEAVEVTKRQDPLALEVLSTVYVSRNDIPRALESAEEGLQVALRGHPSYVASFRKRIQTLQNHLRKQRAPAPPNRTPLPAGS